MLINQNQIRQTLRTTFTPAQPIKHQDHLAGRRTELNGVLDALASPGEHACIYGEPAIGKSSLAQVCRQILRDRNRDVLYLTCSPPTTFESICTQICEHLGISLDGESQATEQSTQTSASIGINESKVGGKAELKETTTRHKQARQLDPGSFARLVANRSLIVILDEFDSIGGTRDKELFAHFMKACSDDAPFFKLVLVGVAESIEDLLAGHASAWRSLHQECLRPLDDPAIADIVENGAKLVGMTVRNEFTRTVVSYSDGFPYFVHLLCLHGFDKAILKNDLVVTKQYLAPALAAIANSSKVFLNDEARQAVDDGGRPSRELALTLKAAALCRREFEIDEVIRELARNSRVERISMERALSFLCERRVLKMRRYQYAFANPLLRTYFRHFISP